MNIALWPFEIRLIIVLLLGMVSARFINWAIYTWAYFPRQVGPWSPPASTDKKSTKGKGKGKSKEGSTSTTRSWKDHLPVIGWWRLRNESDAHGNGYWIRPFFIELIYPIFLAWYFKFQITAQGMPPGAARLILPIELHIQFVGHCMLFTLMMIATFIDFDEQSIPDYVTIPGTVIGIVGAALAPLWLPLNLGLAPGGIVAELDFAWPGPIPAWAGGTTGLAIALAIIGTWGFALLDRRVILRRGLGKAVKYFWARMFRYRPLWITVLSVTAGLMIFVTLCWTFAIPRWNLLFSSLMGLAYAGGLTWAVRIAARMGLGIEALGFGDVTLMAMIGTYIGLQPSLAVFFLAPFVAMLFVVVRWLITRQTATPYGPYLCAAVLILFVFWDSIWTSRVAAIFLMAEDIAEMLHEPVGNWVTGTMVVIAGTLFSVLLIGAMLWVWQLVKMLLLGAEEPDSNSQA